MIPPVIFLAIGKRKRGQLLLIRTTVLSLALRRFGVGHDKHTLLHPSPQLFGGPQCVINFKQLSHLFVTDGVVLVQVLANLLPNTWLFGVEQN